MSNSTTRSNDPPTVLVHLKNSWGQVKMWVNLDPCPHCGKTRHQFAAPRGVEPELTLGTNTAPCGQPVSLERHPSDYDHD